MRRIPVCLLALAFLAPSGPAFAGAKSPGKAALLSLLLPGAGELYAGGHRSGRFFLFTEASFWGGMFAFRALQSAREATFKSWAAVHAGAHPEGKPNSYFDEMGQFQSIYTRNEREIFLAGDQAVLRPETPDQIWEWDSEASRLKFQHLHSSANSAKQKAFLFIGALVFNRFASALNAARIAQHTQPPAQPSSFHLDFGASPQAGVRACLQAAF